MTVLLLIAFLISNSNKVSNKNQKSTAIKHQTEKKKQNLTNSKSIYCISINLVNISQIPVRYLINGSIAIDALSDNGSCLTLLRKFCICKDAVIHEWQDGPYASPEGDCTPSGWITLRIQVGKIDYTMPKVGLYESLPIAMILGRDLQAAVHATIIIEPNGAIFINIQSTFQEFGCIKSNKSFIGCVIQSRYDNKPLISKTPTLINSKAESYNVTEDVLSNEEKLLENMLIEYNDIFSTSENEIDEFSNFHMEINLTKDIPIKCKPYKTSEIGKQFMREQVEKWIKSGVCKNSTSPSGTPAFVIEQPHHESTSRSTIHYQISIPN